MKTKFYFDDLNDSQKQKLAETMLDSHPIRLNNELIEYVLKKSYEDQNAPFSYDDITNNESFGSIVINNCEYQLTEDERGEKLEFYEYLESKAQGVYDALEKKWLKAEGDEQSDKLNATMEKFEAEKLQRLSDIVEELENLECYEQKEIYQWFSCDSWLIRELENYGECTLDSEFWGRTCCGQSVILDHVIQKIAFESACHHGNDHLVNAQIEALGDSMGVF